MSKSQIAWNGFGSLKTSDELLEYLRREYEHSGYYHYTSLTSIDAILEKNTIWLSPVTRFNDRSELKQFGKDSELYFSLCFSTGINENLPLWYLYSGVDGQGGKLSFTKSSVSKLIQHGKYYLSTNKSNINIIELSEDNCELSFKDMLYYKLNQRNNYVDLKYNTKTNYNNISLDNFENFKKKYGPFVKSLIWFYEKETRLLIKLKGNAAEYIKKHSMPKDEYYVVKLLFSEIPGLSKSVKIGFAPEIVDLEETISKYENIRSFMYENSSVSLSAYQGQIEMGLRERICKECSKNK